MTTSRAGRDRIFISYRRAESAIVAGRLQDGLQLLFGRERVFQDVTMAPGARFPAVLQAELDRAAVLLVVMGRDWVRLGDPSDGRRRIDDPDDWVRNEITSALDADIAIIPLLIDDAVMPPPRSLPADIAPLAGLLGRQMRTGYWAEDLDQLARVITQRTGWPIRRGVAAPVRLFGQRPPAVAGLDLRSRAAELIRFDDNTVLILQGVGEPGPSRMAAQYFDDHQAEFDFAAWVDLLDKGGANTYRDIARELGLDVTTGESATIVRGAIEEATDERWLMVFDNAAGLEDVTPLLPDGTHVNVIVTSSAREWGPLGPVVEVDEPPGRPMELAANAKRPWFFSDLNIAGMFSAGAAVMAGLVWQIATLQRLVVPVLAYFFGVLVAYAVGRNANY